MRAELTAHIVKRPLWKRILRFPLVCRSHYRVFRRHNHGRIVSLYGAWLMAGLTVKV